MSVACEALRDGGARLPKVEVSQKSALKTLKYSAKDPTVSILSSFVGMDGLTVQVKLNSDDDGNIFSGVGQHVNMTWKSRKRLREEGLRETTVSVTVVKKNLPYLHLRVDKSDLPTVEFAKIGECSLYDVCWLVLTAESCCEKSPLLAFPRYSEVEGEEIWSFFRKTDCLQHYGDLIEMANNTMVFGVPEGYIAVPTIQFRTEGYKRLDRFTIGDFALLVSQDEVFQKLNVIEEEARQTVMEGSAAAPMAKRKTVETDPIVEQFTPAFVVQHMKAILNKRRRGTTYGEPKPFLVWTNTATIYAKCVHAEKDSSCQSAPQVTRCFADLLHNDGNGLEYRLKSFTSPPFVSEADTYIGAKLESTRGRDTIYRYLKFRMPTDDVEADTLKTGDDVKVLRAVPDAACEDGAPIRFFFEDGNVVYPATWAGEEMVTAERSFVEQRLRIFTESKDGCRLYAMNLQRKVKEKKKMDGDVYAASFSAGSSFSGTLRLASEEDESGIRAVCTLRLKTKEWKWPLDYIPLSICVTGDSTLWLSTKDEGKVLRIGNVFETRKSAMKIDLQTWESVVEIIALSENSVIAVTPSKVFRIDGEKHVRIQNIYFGYSMYGVQISSNVGRAQSLSGIDSSIAFSPIDFYPGIRKEIDERNETIIRDDDGHIVSIDCGGDHDVLVNARKEDFLVAQHLLDFVLVERAKMRIPIQSVKDAFVLHYQKTVGYGTSQLAVGNPDLALANDCFFCIRHPYIYDKIEEDEFHFNGELIYPYTVVSRTVEESEDGESLRDAFASAGIICCFENKDEDIKGGSRLCFKYGNDFWFTT